MLVKTVSVSHKKVVTEEKMSGEMLYKLGWYLLACASVWSATFLMDFCHLNFSNERKTGGTRTPSILGQITICYKILSLGREKKPQIIYVDTSMWIGKSVVLSFKSMNSNFPYTPSGL